ncbi:hypothetical protein JCM8547_006863 [Rhodosporidiobolus lusitaniae]
MGLSSLVSKASSSLTGSSSSPAKAGGSTSPPGSAGGTQGEDASVGAAAEDTETLEEENKSILLSLISQLRVGMDLSRVSLPVFVLEPRSMLERVTDFHSHPELLHGATNESTPEERFIRVLRYYLAGWHIKPRGVKKPYNPILGEIFRCRYDYADGTVGYYIAEQVSHHPPISAWYFASPEQGLELCGELRPKSKFLGNSAATLMDGENHVRFLDGPGAADGEYDIEMPNMYARGILFGKMVLELGDQVVAKNDTTGVRSDIDFKTKGFFSGQYNSLVGKIKGPKGDVGEVSGFWSDTMELTRKGKSKEVLFDAHKASVMHKSVSPEEQQQPNESRRLWSKVTAAIKAKDLDAATDAKGAIEDAQREQAKEREARGETFVPRYFKPTGKNGEWRPTFAIPAGDKASQREAVRAFVYGADPEPPFSPGHRARSATTNSVPGDAALAAQPTATTTAPPPTST